MKWNREIPGHSLWRQPSWTLNYCFGFINFWISSSISYYNRFFYTRPFGYCSPPHTLSEGMILVKSILSTHITKHTLFGCFFLYSSSFFVGDFCVTSDSLNTQYIYKLPVQWSLFWLLFQMVKCTDSLRQLHFLWTVIHLIWYAWEGT